MATERAVIAVKPAGIVLIGVAAAPTAKRNGGLHP
jgi:hypothetical protein